MIVEFASWKLEFISAAVVLFFSYFLYYKLVISRYWEKRNIAHVDPVFIVGNILKVLSRGPFYVLDIHREYKKNKIFGIWAFHQPILICSDIEIIKKILIKDFANFPGHNFKFDLEREPLTGHLFNLKGSRWRNLRVKLTHLFTSKQMKMMFPIMVQCGKQLQEYLKTSAAVDKDEVAIKDILLSYSTDVIASCSFGVDLNSFKNPDSEFKKYGRQLFAPSPKTAASILIFHFFPKLYGWLKLRLIPEDLSNFFINTVKDLMEYREKNQIERSDFLQLFIQLKNKGRLDDVDKSVPTDYLKIEDGTDIPEEDLKFGFLEAAAQAFAFFFGGFETTSNTLTFALYELAMNFDVQLKLQEEIDRVLQKHNFDISYQSVMEMEFLDWVVQETLRKHPPAPALTRTCNIDYEIPELGVKIDKGTIVSVPVFGLHWDPDLFPNPAKFDPNRFSPEEKSKRNHFSPLHFGDGPRNCIGNRFALLLIKVCLASILSHYNVEVSKNTPIIFKYQRHSQILSPEGEMMLKISRRVS